MFEGDSADLCAGKFPLMLMGAKRGSSVPRPGSKDPHRILGWPHMAAKQGQDPSRLPPIPESFVN